MKKVLLASTALVMTAGFAAAEVSSGVSISGSAEMGIADKDTDDTGVQFFTDYDLDLNLSGETDGGLSFGATIDLDEVGNGISNETADEGTTPVAVFIEGNFGKLEIGDVDGAYDLVNLETTFLSSLNDDHTAHAGFFNGAALDGALNGHIATYSYEFGGFLFAVSAEIGDGELDDDIDPNVGALAGSGILSNLDSEEIFGVGVRYTTEIGLGQVSASLAYQGGEYTAPTIAGTPATIGGSTLFGIARSEGDLIGTSLELELDNGFTGRINYSNFDGELDAVLSSATATLGVVVVSADLEWDHYGIGLVYETGPFGVEVNYGKFDGNVEGIGDFEADGFGIAAIYDLGGGAEVQVGYGSGDGFAFDGTDVDTTNTFSAGLAFSF